MSKYFEEKMSFGSVWDKKMNNRLFVYVCQYFPMSRNELKLENLANTTRWNFDDQHNTLRLFIIEFIYI